MLKLASRRYGEELTSEEVIVMHCAAIEKKRREDLNEREELRRGSY
jgi:hypothetical protein